MYGRPGSRERELIGAWEFEPDVDREVAEARGAERLDDPDAYVVVLSSGPGWMCAELVSGAPPRVGGFLYMNDRGLFEVTRVREASRQGDENRGLLVMLGSVPHDDEASLHF